MLDLYLFVVGGAALALGLASGRIRDLPFSDPVVALLLGVLIGPVGLGVADLPTAASHETLEIVARLVLAVSLTAVALRYPVRELVPSKAALVLLLVAGMVGMAAVGAVIAGAVLGLGVGAAALLGAILSPTDPVLASSVVTGKPAARDLPPRLRQLLSLESGANDGLALPLVLLGVALVLAEPLERWAVEAVREVALAVVLGVLIGWLAGWMVNFASRHDDVEDSAFLVLTLALGLFTLGAVELAHGNGILGVFVAGLTYNYVIGPRTRETEWQVDEGVNRFMVLPVFTLLGVALPWEAWRSLGWAGVAFTVAILVLRRLPVVLLLRRPLHLSWPDALFLGWFGPIGVAALFYLSHAAGQGAVDNRLWAAGTMVVAASTLIHGVSAAWGRHRYADATGMHERFRTSKD